LIFTFQFQAHVARSHLQIQHFNHDREYTLFSGDSISFSALLYDLNTYEDRFLGSYSASHHNAFVTWTLNGNPLSTDSVVSFSVDAPGVDTIVAF